MYKSCIQKHFQMSFQSLERWASVGEKLHEVVLEPSTSLGSRLESVSVSAVSIVPRSAGIRCTITLATRLDPHVGVQKRIVSGRAGSETETCANDVAPVTPGLLFGRLYSVAA
jgi:hypothetical protein